MIDKIIFLMMFLCATAYANNDLYVSDRYNNGYPESKYIVVLETVKRVYEPILKKTGGSLVIEDDWSDGAVNMWAERWGDQYRLEIPGGMARYHLIEEEGFVTSICHELGHLLGGDPGRGVISYEGQSDYFAGLDCVEKILNELSPYKVPKPTGEVILACDNYVEEDVSLCHRSLIGALSLSSYYAELEKVDFPKISTPSRVVVDKTLKVHPPAQCRLDTFVAGFFKKERPVCWYKE